MKFFSTAIIALSLSLSASVLSAPAPIPDPVSAPIHALSVRATPIDGLLSGLESINTIPELLTALSSILRSLLGATGGPADPYNALSSLFANVIGTIQSATSLIPAGALTVPCGTNSIDVTRLLTDLSNAKGAITTIEIALASSLVILSPTQKIAFGTTITNLKSSLVALQSSITTELQEALQCVGLTNAPDFLNLQNSSTDFNNLINKLVVNLQIGGNITGLLSSFLGNFLSLLPLNLPTTRST